MTIIAQSRGELLQFQLTHPWGCDSSLSPISTTHTVFQLTHPWGCDCYASLGCALVAISTHTPVRVWREAGSKYLKARNISTHTPVRVWLIDPVLFDAVQKISTHTPVRVWPDYTPISPAEIKFQLTHPWGCDKIIDSLKIIPLFQLTHPWGCDPTNCRQ